MALSLLRLNLRPNFSSSTAPTSIDITLKVSNYFVAANKTLVRIQLAFGNVPTQRYDGDAIEACDEQGNLRLVVHDSDDNIQRSWITKRNTCGDITLRFTAYPRKVDINTPIGPRVDLRNDQGGLLGAGCGMLPLPPEPEQVFNITVDWDLQHAPAGTRTASSLGEGKLLTIRDKLEALQLSLFAVAATLRRYPSEQESPKFGMFWFGDSPFNVPSLSSYIKTLHDNMSSFFQDQNEPPYRIFFRSSPRAFGGAGYRNSFMLEYFTGISLSIRKLGWLLAHEIVHNWPLLEGPRIDTERSETIWWNEGIATYYQSLLPYRFDLISKSQLMHEMNSLAQAYYTNPAIHLSNYEAAKRAWVDTNAQRLPYHRGMMYFINAAHLIRQKSAGASSLDELVLQILHRRRSGQHYRLEDWQKLVSSELGGCTARQLYEFMAAGRHLIVPLPDCLAYLGLKMRRKDQEPFELGFAGSSLNARKIEGLVAGSRAEEAGIREGDGIAEVKTMMWEVMDEFETRMSIVLRRKAEPEKMHEVTYWPRGYEKVESWSWVDV